MIAPRRQRGQTLILIAAWLFFAGGASIALVAYNDSVESMRKAVQQVVTDKARKDVILSNIKLWESVQELEGERLADAREDLFKKLRRQNTQRADIEPILAELDQTFGVMDWDFLNLRDQVKQQVSSAEWAKIAPQTGN
jgi:hypothetical protein